MFKTQQGPNADGKSEEKPIVMPHVAELEFDIFVSQAYGQ
jgi:hypothetical protein